MLARNADVSALYRPTPLYKNPSSGSNSRSCQSDKKHPGAYKCTPLARAVHARNQELIDLLLQYGADASIKSSEGQTPIDDDARELGCKAIERKLRDHRTHSKNSLN